MNKSIDKDNFELNNRDRLIKNKNKGLLTRDEQVQEAIIAVIYELF